MTTAGQAPEASAAEAPPSRPTPTRSPDIYWNAVAVIVTAKALFFVVAFLAYSFFDYNVWFWEHTLLRPDTESFNFLSALKTWDGNHYIRLAEEGYQRGEDSNAFYPLYPGLIWLLNLVTGNRPIAALIAANLASLGGLYVFYLFVRRHFSPVIAMRALLLMLAFPTAYYLHVAYSEGLFLLLMMGCFWFLYQDSYGRASICAFLLTLTRPLGIVIVVPFVLYMLQKGLASTPESEPLQRRLWMALTTLPGYDFVAPICAFVAYLTYMQLTTGNAFEGMDAQKLYAADYSVSNLLQPLGFVREVFASNLVLHDFTRSITARVFFGGFLLSLILVYRKVDKPMFVYCALLGVIPPLLGGFMSYPRFLLLTFPIFIAFATVLDTHWRPAMYAVFAGSITLQVFFAARHVLNFWVA